MSALDLTPFRSAIAQLQQSLEDVSTYPDIESIQAGVIQCFEFTYDLCPKCCDDFLQLPSRHQRTLTKCLSLT